MRSVALFSTILLLGAPVALAEADAAGDPRRLRIIGDRVAIYHDVGSAQRLLSLASCDVHRSEVNQKHMIVCSASNQPQAALFQRLG